MDLQTRLADIDWRRFSTAYGSAAGVPDLLLDLFGKNPGAARKASHDLWCGLCHQHAFLSSAALPALPFLLEALDVADDTLKVEILDILTGFAICSCPEWASKFEGWILDLRAALSTETHRFLILERHPNEEIADFASSIVECTLPRPHSHGV